jgi:hypothetical protein
LDQSGSYAQGTRFDNCCIFDAPCLPSRTALWSGQAHHAEPPEVKIEAGMFTATCATEGAVVG